MNVTLSLKSNEPFVLACQAEQVFYVKSIRNPQWHFVIKTEPQNYYNMPSPKEENDDEEEDDIKSHTNRMIHMVIIWVL